MSTLTDLNILNVTLNPDTLLESPSSSTINNNGSVNGLSVKEDDQVVTVSAESATAAVATVTIHKTSVAPLEINPTANAGTGSSKVPETLTQPPSLIPTGQNKSNTMGTMAKVNQPPTGTAAVTSTTGPPPLLQNRSQDVRVDNWGNYCLQRLQVMYEKGDFTDLTLQFNNQELVKVHRVVVNLCTDFFINLERLFGLVSETTLVLPNDIEYQAMLTIIKFFYTGKLEVRGNQFNEVYRTVKLMNITILTKLLEAHARKPVQQANKEPTSRPIVFKQPVEMGKALTKIQLTSAQAAALLPGGTITKKTLSTRQLPPGVKTKTVLARVQTQGGFTRQQAHVAGIGNVSLIRSTSQKKLPIWKERKYTQVVKSEPQVPEKWTQKEELARPTRFEWPDPEEESSYMTTTTTSFMERQNAMSAVQKAANAKRGEEIFDAVKSQMQAQPQGLKRTIASTYTDIRTPRSESESPSASKISKITLDIEKELAEMEGSDLDDDHGFPVALESNHEHPQMITQQQQPIHNQTLKFEAKPIQIQRRAPPPTPTAGIMKSSGPSATPLSERKAEKTVRFAPEIYKDKNKKNVGSVPPPHSLPTPPGTLIIPSEESTAPGDLLSNHSKIISEVLKKYPQLVKDNRNIKLKIVQKASPNDCSGTGTGSKSKVSYIVLKSTSSPDSPGSVVLKKPNAATKASGFWDSPEKLAKKLSSAEQNAKGPWICAACLVEDIPTEFDSYFTYRRHLVEIHGEKIDARICEYCAYKASKRNLLLYHKYTKHGIDPPLNCSFPHCDRCDYVALSESLLVKHRLAHDNMKDVSCTICNMSFKSHAGVNEHMVTNLHRNINTKNYDCPYCKRPFVRILSLKAHIRLVHRDIARLEEMNDPNLPPLEALVAQSHDRSLTVIAKKSRQLTRHVEQTSALDVHMDPHMHGMEQVSLVTADGSTIEILHGIDPTMSDGSIPISLVPSSEAEAMNNVASSIAASLGLDVHGQQVGIGAEYDGSQAVYIMDGSNQAVEVNMSGIEMTADGNMIIGGDDGIGSGQFIVQDMQGNQFQRITGIDENGKQVIFFQLSDEHGQISMAPTMLDESGQIMNDGEGTVVQQFEFDPTTGQTGFNVQNDHMYLDPQKCSVFVSSGGTISGPVATNAGIGGSHMVLTSTPDGNQLIEMVPIQTTSDDMLHHHHQQSIDLAMSHAGQQLHIVVDQGVAQEVQHEGEIQHQDGMYAELSEIHGEHQNDVEVMVESHEMDTGVQREVGTHDEQTEESEDIEDVGEIVEEGGGDDLLEEGHHQEIGGFIHQEHELVDEGRQKIEGQDREIEFVDLEAGEAFDQVENSNIVQSQNHDLSDEDVVEEVDLVEESEGSVQDEGEDIVQEEGSHIAEDDEREDIVQEHHHIVHEEDDHIIQEEGDQIIQEGDQIIQEGDQIIQEGDRIVQEESDHIINEDGDQIIHEEGDQIIHEEDDHIIHEEGDHIVLDRVHIEEGELMHERNEELFEEGEPATELEVEYVQEEDVDIGQEVDDEDADSQILMSDPDENTETKPMEEELEEEVHTGDMSESERETQMIDGQFGLAAETEEMDPDESLVTDTEVELCL